MKSINFKALTLLLFVSTLWTACKKEDDSDSKPGDVEINMDNVAGTAPLSLNSPYITAFGDTVRFTTFNYFVSNFVFIKKDGSEYIVPKDSCYFLVKHEDSDSKKLLFKNIPAGDYSGVRFTIGVDSLKSVSDASQRTGVLDPATGAAGMYWVWNSGYIFVKVEGSSPQAPADANGHTNFQYHTGLFGGFSSPTLNNLKTVTISSTTDAAEVHEGHTPEFHVFVNILEMFTNPTNISIAANPTSHAGPFSKTVADNYADMFKLDHIHN